MDSHRSSLDRDYEKSDQQLQHSRHEAVIQHAADTMIAVTESYRDHYRQQVGDGYDGYEPRLPQPTYTHSRSSSASSTSTHQLLNSDPMRRHPSISSLPSIPSPDPQYRIPDILTPGLPPTECQSLLGQSREDLETQGNGLDDPISILRLTTPNLPPRLNTPHTPPPPEIEPVVVSPRHLQPYILSTHHDRQPSDIQDHVGGFRHATRHSDAFKNPSFRYTSLPDIGTERTEPRPLGTTTHIRSGSDMEPLMSTGVRRKPLAPGAKTVEFNHSFSFINEILFVTVICLAQVLSQAGLSQALIPARTIGQTFPETTPERLLWYTVAYSLTSGAFILVGTRLGSIFGCKRIFVVGYLWLGFWSLLAGLSNYVRDHGGSGTPYFCFCRAMQGIGPALLIPNGQAMLRKAYPPGQRKALIITLFDVAAPVGFVLGAVFASLFAGFADWPWAFYSTATVCLALAALSIAIIPSRHVQLHALDGSLWERLDLPGLLCGIAALVLFSVGWTQAAVTSFKLRYCIALIIVGAALIAPFVFLESHARHPLVPIKQITACAGVVIGCMAAGWAAFGVWLWYVVQFLEGLRDWKPALVGAGFVPLVVSGGLAAFLSCQFLNQKPRAREFLLLSANAIFISSILMATAPEKQSYWLNAFFSILIIPFGMVLSTPAAEILLGESVPEGHKGLAAGLAATMPGYAISVGLGIAATVEGHVRDREGSLMEEYRAAQYFGVGLGGLSVLLAMSLFVVSFARR